MDFHTEGRQLTARKIADSKETFYLAISFREFMGENKLVLQIHQEIHKPNFYLLLLYYMLNLCVSEYELYSMLIPYFLQVTQSCLTLCDPIRSMEFSSPEYWSGCLSLLQGIFPTQGLKPGVPHCRRILYQLSHKGSPCFWRYNQKNKCYTLCQRVFCLCFLLRFLWFLLLHLGL